MKKYILTIAAFFSIAPLAMAQSQDSLLRRQMELERDFNPTLLDANKINSLPALHEPVIQKANTNYSNWAERTSPPLEIAMPRPGEIMTAIPYSTEKGFIAFSGGNYANMDGALGYKLYEGSKDNLSLNFFHNSTNGVTKYIQDWNESSNKAYFMDNLGQLNYGHQFNNFKLDTRLSYLHSMFNYYGNTINAQPLFNNENQQMGIFNLNFGVKSKKTDFVNYKGYLDIKNFHTKFGETLSADGIRGNQIDAMVGLSKPFRESENQVGVDGRILGSFYKGNITNYLLVTGAPYLNLEGYNWKAKLGADVLIHLVGKTEVRIVPDVKLQLSVTERSSLYANFHGGYDNNTFVDMINESRYILPTQIVKPSFSILDIDLGARIGELSGFRFDIFGGFKQTDDEHFLILATDFDSESSLPISEQTMYEYLTPKYSDISHSHIGGMIKSNIWSPLDLSLRVKKNFYSIKDNSGAKAYNRPGFEVDLRASLDVINNLKFTLNYYLANDRWSYFNFENVKMNNINDLNLGAVYQVTNSFSVNAKVNNLLFQKYDIWYGHPAQGLNVMGGFSFIF